MNRTFSHTAVAATALVAAGGATAVAADLITGKRVKDGSLGVKDLSSKARKALKGNTGRTGLRGATGPTGATGQTGEAGGDGVDGAPGAAATSFLMGSADLPAGSDTTFIRIGADGNDATEANVQVPAPRSGTARNLQVKLTAEPGGVGGGSTRVFTLKVDGTATAVACTVDGIDTTCSSAPGMQAPFAAGSLLSMQEDGHSTKGGLNAARASFSFETTP